MLASVLSWYLFKVNKLFHEHVQIKAIRIRHFVSVESLM